MMSDEIIIDTHVHFLDQLLLTYEWCKNIPLLNKKFLPNDYFEWQSKKVTSIIFVQSETLPEMALKEVEWINELSKNYPQIKGIIAYAPLEKENIGNYLDILKKNNLVKGVRRNIQDENLEFCLNPTFINNLKLLGNYDLTFDICAKHLHLPNIIKMVSSCPNVKFILDHIGKPDIKNGIYDEWNKNIKELSKFKNVFCKISGVITEADINNWNSEEIKKYIISAIEHFGFERILYGSDYPVCLLAKDNNYWLNKCNLLLNEKQWNKFLCQNAINIYKL